MLKIGNNNKFIGSEKKTSRLEQRKKNINLKQLNLAILQFAVSIQFTIHLIYLTLSRASHAFLNSLFIFLC